MSEFRRPLADPAATAALGAALGARLAPGDTLALSGPLGSGKTALARAALQARCGAGETVPSPTFTLLQPYTARDGLALYHLDLYRLAEPDELLELGWDELGGGAILVEWPERAGALLPAERLAIDLAPAAGGREARLHDPAGAWATRLPAVLAALG